MKAKSFHSVGKLVTRFGLICLAFLCVPRAYSLPDSVLHLRYGNASTLFQHFKFPNLFNVESLNPGFLQTLNNNPNTLTSLHGGHSWNLTAQGTTDILGLIQNKARTSIVNHTSGGHTFNALQFGNTTGGALGSLAGVSLAPMSWKAATSIDATSWLPGIYTLEFDFSYLGGLLSLNPNLANNFSIKIMEGSQVRLDLDSTDGLLPDLLSLDLGGLVIGNFIHDVRLDFVYEGTAPITLEFSATQVLGADVLSAISDNALYSVANIDIGVSTVPEPTGLLLVMALAVPISLYRRRQS